MASDPVEDDDGEGESPPPVPYRRFRMAFWPIWRAEMFVLVICAFLDSLLTYLQFRRFELRPIPIPWPHAIVIALFFSSICIFFPVYLRADGLKLPDDHGTQVAVRWDEIAKFRYFDFLGMKVLRIPVEGHPAALWLPLYLVQMRQFADLVAQHAGEDHPLAVRLARYRTRADRP